MSSSESIHDYTIQIYPNLSITNDSMDGFRGNLQESSIENHGKSMVSG